MGTHKARSSVSACFSPKAALRCRSASAFASSAAAIRASALWRNSPFLLKVSSACSGSIAAVINMLSLRHQILSPDYGQECR